MTITDGSTRPARGLANIKPTAFLTPRVLAAAQAVLDAAEATPERDGVQVPTALLDELAQAVDEAEAASCR